MPALNKQTLINLLIDSPLREPIKINLIDIINNTKDEDLPKVYPTITKELEIFQKATDRRLKLADETIKKLSGEAPTSNTPPPPAPPTPQADDGLQVPPLDLPPLPKPAAPAPAEPTPAAAEPASAAPPPPAPPAPSDEGADEEALKEIQKELDALKGDVATDLSADKAVEAPTPPTT